MGRVIIFAIIAFLMWMEIVPVRKWICEIKIKLICTYFRTKIELLGYLNELVKLLE